MNDGFDLGGGERSAMAGVAKGTERLGEVVVDIYPALQLLPG